VETDIGLVVISRFYGGYGFDKDLYSEKGWPAVIKKLAEVTGRDVKVPEKYVDEETATHFEKWQKEAFYSVFDGRKLEKVDIRIEKAVCDVVYCDVTVPVGDGEQGNYEPKKGLFTVKGAKVHTVSAR
jgi:hypothetical protein